MSLLPIGGSRLEGKQSRFRLAARHLVAFHADVYSQEGSQNTLMWFKIKFQEKVGISALSKSTVITLDLPEAGGRQGRRWRGCWGGSSETLVAASAREYS